MRSAPAHLLADSAAEPFRFLSISDIGYDPGDLDQLQALYDEQLPQAARYDLIVVTKMKEVLAFNLPLRYRLHSVDGYDGGLLPIRDYVQLERLFLAEEEIWPDGRLRQQLEEIPPTRLLSLLNVKYVITDKTQDAWIDGIYYDLEHTVQLGSTTLDELPSFETTHLGIISSLTGAADVADGAPVARITVTGTGGERLTRDLRAGDHTAEAAYGDQPVRHRQPKVARRRGRDGASSDYVSVVDLGSKVLPESITIQSLLPSGEFQICGLSLIDSATGTSRTLTVNSSYRLVHSGDVKVYQNLDMLPRAFVVHRARVMVDDESTLALLRDRSFDPSQEVVLAKGEAMTAEGGHTPVEIITYKPEQIQARARLDAPGYLVLTDAFYPGWTAEVDGRPLPILRADLYFRAVALEQGEHEITFRYQPASARAGLAASIAALLVWIALFAATNRDIGRNRPSSV
jgi:hypothetical protein